MVLLTVLLWGLFGAGVGGHRGVGTNGVPGAGRLEIAHEAVEQLAEQAGLGLVPAREGGEGPLGPQGAGGVQRLGAGRGEAEQAGPPVLRVGTALDVAEPLQDGELPAGDRDVHAHLEGQGAAALVAVALGRGTSRAQPKEGRPP